MTVIYFSKREKLLEDLHDLILTMRSPNFIQLKSKWLKKLDKFNIEISLLSESEKKLFEIEHRGWMKKNDFLVDN
jgi:hypothetical protein